MSSSSVCGGRHWKTLWHSIFYWMRHSWLTRFGAIYLNYTYIRAAGWIHNRLWPHFFVDPHRKESTGHGHGYGHDTYKCRSEVARLKCSEISLRDCRCCTYIKPSHSNTAGPAIHSITTTYLGNIHMPDISRRMAFNWFFAEMWVDSSSWPLVCSVSFTDQCLYTCRPADPPDFTGQIRSLEHLFAEFLFLFACNTEIRVLSPQCTQWTSQHQTCDRVGDDVWRVVHPWCPWLSCPSYVLVNIV